MMIVCDGLVKIYKTNTVEVMALQGLDMNVAKGELMAVVGNSGSGKSTFLNMVGGLIKPSAGQLLVDGKDLFRLSEKQLVDYKRNTVGFVWQKNSRNLFPYLSAIRNVEVPMQFCKDNEAMRSEAKRRERALELLELVGMSHRKDSLLHQLSGGEQQRVAIAIALANRPKLLLADEPTGAVDQKTSLMIQDMFRVLNRELGVTIVIVTHDVSLSKKVDRVVMIRDGKISSERVMKQGYLERMKHLDVSELETENMQEEFAVLDRAGRVQLTKGILEQAGIEGNRVRIEVQEGKIIISA
ncbi:ABC transporter ATP-binding protein [Kineothrix sedimenti]|uniref:ABC transporter ATP-binding protein n=1 Tax=Kineothrix sedimenti TaxID=3123317 RepID=A0ABZ3F4N9_9FIRM